MQQNPSIQKLKQLFKQLKAVDESVIEVSNINPLKAMAFDGAKELFYSLVERVKPVILSNPVRLAVSFGKDSLVMLAVFVEAHKQLIENGQAPAAPLIVTRSDTGIDSPVMACFAKRQIQLLQKYLDKHDIPSEIIEAKPADRYSWAVMYLSGLKLLTVGASKTADCSVELKINPLSRIERSLAKRYPNIVTATGVRLAESADRAESIRKFGLGSATVVESCVNGQVSRDFAPIVDLSTNDIWMIARCFGSSASREYGDYLPYWAPSTWYLRKLYDDQSDSCPIVASGAQAGGTSGGCSSSLRSGCALCTVVAIDKQAEVLADLPQYPQLQNLLAIRNWLSHHFFDLSYRRFIGRKPDEHGYVCLQPNTFNERWMTQVLRWCLQADADEKIRAERFRSALFDGSWEQDSGIRSILDDPDLTNWQKAEWLHDYIDDMQHPTFCLVTPTQLLLIEAMWSRDGYKLAPFTALQIWHDVYHLGMRVDYPEISGPKFLNKLPKPRYIQVGSDPSFQDLTDVQSSQVYQRYITELDSVAEFPDGCGVERRPKIISTTPVVYAGKAGATVEGWFGDWTQHPCINPMGEEDENGYTIDADAAELITGLMIGDYLAVYRDFTSGRLGDGLDCRANVSLRRLIHEGVLRLSSVTIMNTAALMARAHLYELAGLTFMAECDDEFLSRTISEQEYLHAVMNSRQTAPVVVLPTVASQMQDMARALLEVRQMYRALVYSKSMAQLTIEQCGRNFLFDGKPFASLVATQSVQIQKIRQLAKSPDSILSLLPACASVRKARPVELDAVLATLLVDLSAEFNSIQQSCWEHILTELSQEPTNSPPELKMIFVGKSMGFIKEPIRAMDYVRRQLAIMSMTLSVNKVSGTGD